MELKHIFLLIALVAIGVVAIPSIYSLFSGQHSFYNPEQETCVKCHVDIRNEMDVSVYHLTFTCGNCHVDPNLNNSGLTHENVVQRRCLECHNDITVVVDGNDNTQVSSIAENIYNNKESHHPLILEANSSPIMKGENEACVSCHTIKSLQMKISFANAYKLKATRITGAGDEWQMSDYSRDVSGSGSSPLSIESNGTAGTHTFPSLADFRCEKCHARERNQLDNSNSHTTLSCDTCHQLEAGYHAADIPSCLSCHIYPSDVGADAHTPFVSNANNSGEKDIACSSCHSSFNDSITFIRPSFIEWDVRDVNNTWLIENLTFGINKDISVQKNLDGKLHNISLDGNCVSCHDDIRNAVISGGHSNERWKGRHNYVGYADMNVYCRSCHIPQTQNSGGQSPYPAYPFNSDFHSAIKVACIDCHTKADLRANINGQMISPPFNSGDMGNIDVSMVQQPYFVQSYLCIACKNTGNPSPNNGSLHFKVLTEPEITVYLNGVPH